MALSKEENQAIGRQVGYTGEFGAGGAAAWRAANPEKNQIWQKMADAREAELKTQAAAQVPLTAYVAGQVQNPTLPKGTTFTPVTQQVQSNEVLAASPNAVLDPTALQVAQLPQVVAPQIQQQVAQAGAPVAALQGQATAVDPNAALAGFNPNAGQTTAALTQAVPDMQAAQGQVSNEATVQGQLEKLMNFDSKNIPAWAKGAAAKANDAMGARGLGASNLSAGAIVAAIQQAALPIAAQDASSFFQMDITNLNNKQQANLENTRMRQQNMLTDTAITNASAQFNAANAQQTEQFTSSLISSIMEQNAARKDAMSQLNVTQGNQVSLQNAAQEQQNQQFNASQGNAIGIQNAENNLSSQQFNVQQESARRQFNSTLQNQREQFNSQMQFAIDQSNVLWRRQVNTQNNAEINASNQANVQNLFNMSAVAQNNLWQQFRDEASWIFSGTQNDLNRNFNSAMAANNRNFASGQSESSQNASLMAGLGGLAVKLFSSL